MNNFYDVIIIGAGAAGLFCASTAGNKNKKVLVLDHANKVGKKILMSGGGRCNFTNLFTTFEDFTSENPHFSKSALNQYSPHSFLELVEKHNIEYIEKSAGQLFCKNTSKDILQMLLDECAKAGVKIYKKCEIFEIYKNDEFNVNTNIEQFKANNLVIATGGLSIPTLGATGFGYKIAEQFGHKLVKTKPSLVPFVLSKKQREIFKTLSGVSLKVSVTNKVSGVSVKDEMLFTHRGISGPAILKISAYWKQGDEIEINFLPEINFIDYIEAEKTKHPEQLLTNCLSRLIPKRLSSCICSSQYQQMKIKQLDNVMLNEIAKRVHHWKLKPERTEGYKTAEVTSGGVSTEHISSKTFESKLLNNLYFIGEVLDVTGQLGGYNFQWAWSSAWCAGQSIN